MLRNHSNTDLDDAPHTLRSDLCSQGISIPRPSHHSLTRISNALEISQSPNGVFIHEPRNSQCPTSDTQTPCTNIICNESSCCTPVPSELPSNLCTTNQEKYQQSSDHLCLTSKRNEEEVSEDKNTDGHKSNPFSEQESHLSNIFSCPDVLPSSSVYSSDQFFSFVIFHAPEDQEIACRVCNVLEHHVVGKGTTFCEGFETPGVNPLMCLENAVENSAYIVLLLTNAFLKATWTHFQSATVMMNSIYNPDKLWSIIPFYPKLNKPNGKIPIWIKNLIPLDESSCIFETKVRNTFKKEEIKKRNTLWEKKLRRTTSDFQQPQNISLQCSMSDATAVLPQQTQPQFAVFHGQTPVIQISHAGNVQIGNQNTMNIQFSPNEPQMVWDTNMYHDAGNETPN
ncbi:TIR domain-containing adapter molecule 1-like [Rana temporaria]|uniref:TIR domain-containing adapter molecule 1-like n=1 Tax=Rana temporaria TaxID=8407 RepID=UPI001AAD98E0|nr:TIR domain-containing adapter molecule 1-like [Rana temporaria]XP_040178312.1 TIR domain-containing adapter molecule 1-like [Rana temporaria]XP_040178318.1 TIR domain-containing adapter molecule 1-like [Rana temporaria]XP_040178325.1 TIR domain-containing adapter molecule 1-like [Rana temporaria]XP_040178332.1 TIR domain-containing adapter molecule 1-like [Rana temporaria]XP_040178339.1 TIR domain-containing adapter molecule 1-like [Rana temporaria]XP_040178346.1 TIR domain-containing adap